MLESMRSCGVFNPKNRASEKTKRVRKKNTKQKYEKGTGRKSEEEIGRRDEREKRKKRTW